MKSMHLRRSLVAVATTIACLATTASPASAVTYIGTITAGEITFTKTGITPEIFDLAPTGTGACPSGTITLDFGPTNTTIFPVGVNIPSIRTFTTGTSYYVLLTRSPTGSTSGTVSGGTTFSSMRIAIVAQLYSSFNVSTCTPSGTAICTLAYLLHLNGTLSGVSTSNTFAATGASVGTVVPYPSCTGGPSYLVGSVGTVTLPLASHLS